LFLTGTKSYKRICKFGKGMDTNGTDIDECKNNKGLNIGMCKNGMCVNTIGGFRCKCASGFKNNKDDNKVCEGKFISRRSTSVCIY